MPTTEIKKNNILAGLCVHPQGEFVDLGVERVCVLFVLLLKALTIHIRL